MTQASVDGAPGRADARPAPRLSHLVVLIAGATALLILAAALLALNAAHAVNRTPMAATPQGVTVVAARSEAFQDTRTYVGAVEPWVEASVGPQYVSAYVKTVLVRPGAAVSSGQVLATLDCTSPTAATRAVAMRARAIDARLRASVDEAARVVSMLDGGFVAPNEAEQKVAAGASQQAQLLESQADLARASLDVHDCVLRAPFEGEVAARNFDPGAFVHPGAAIVAVVDRRTVRVTVDASEKDFDALAPGGVVRITLLAVGQTVAAPISRRAPKADPKTRTIHFEVDLPDADERYPVGTTAGVHVDVGAPVPATAVPVYAATQESGKAKLFVVDHDVAHAKTLPVLGESGGSVFFSPQTLAPGTNVVLEGRALLTDGEHVQPAADVEAPGDTTSADAGPSIRGGGFGRPL